MTDAPYIPSAWQIERSVVVFEQIRQYLLRDDDELAADESAIAHAFYQIDAKHPLQILSALIDAVVWTELRAIEADDLHKRLAARRDRYTKRAQYLRQQVADLLGVVERRSHQAGLGRALLVNGRRAVIVTDVAKLPDDCVEIIRKPNKIVIGEKLDRGEAVPGAELSTPGLVLQIRGV